MWTSRRMVEVPESTRCATCRRDDLAFFVLDKRDGRWRCSACASPAVAIPAEAPRARSRLRARHSGS